MRVAFSITRTNSAEEIEDVFEALEDISNIVIAALLEKGITCEVAETHGTDLTFKCGD